MNSLRKYINKPLKYINRLYTRANGNENSIALSKDYNKKEGSSEINPELLKTVGYFEKISKHRVILPVYDLEPSFPINCWISPNATLSKI
jgi:hypothetical protein